MPSVSRCGQGYMMGFGAVAIIRVGSCAEGGILYSSDPDSSLMDFDQLRVLDNLCFTDYSTTFGPDPDQPGWYWANEDVMCPRLTNSDGYVNIFIYANKLTFWLKCNFKALHEQNWANLAEVHMSRSQKCEIH